MALLVETSRSRGRDLLEGVHRSITERAHWSGVFAVPTAVPRATLSATLSTANLPSGGTCTHTLVDGDGSADGLQAEKQFTMATKS